VPRERLRDGTFAIFVRSADMANSSFAALVLMVLAVAVTVFLLAPHDRGSAASFGNPAPLWALQR
jgi:hypothetical protein